MAEPADDKDCASSSVWRYARATRAHVVIDAEAYFELMRDAMLGARQRIFLIGWDFDTRIKLSGGRRWWNLPRKDRYPARLGAFVVWLVKRVPALDVKLLKWNFGAIRYLFRGTMIVDLVRWFINRSIEFKFDAAHPVGCSQHEKLAIIDDRLAVCGGIDLTSDRWDTRAHLPEDPRRRRASGKLYPPWHDVAMMMEGEVAEALGELGCQRWRRAGGARMEPCSPQEDSPWPKRLVAEFRDVEVGISRTRAEYDGDPGVFEVEALFVEQIARARRFIYAETQYFASRRIAEAIASRLSEPDPPEFLFITPLMADGWLQQAVMDIARIRLVRALGQVDPHKRFRAFVPFTAGHTPIYVHAKLMIVDDEIIRIGSANMNNRSMGLDSECDVFIDAARPGNAHAVSAIRRIRLSLLAEHCGIEATEAEEMIDRHGSMAGMIDALPRQGKRLEPFALRPLSDTEKALADSAFFDPERPGEYFEPIARRGLFRRGGMLRRPT
ncbi:MAG: phospholipase [Novosphingobium sp.]|nr:phospholipase [Novosphingobium sp.]MCP5401144.1 phospholipase [Novosphingobium sp.]